MVDANEQLQVLLRQETTTYKTEDYLMRLQQQQQQQRIDAPPHSSVASRDGSASSAGIIDQRWREKICEWAYKVIDHFHLKREIVFIAMNYMDRYLANAPTVDKRMFQLLAMTCVYLSIKLHHYSHLLIPGSSSTMESILHLSRGFFSRKEMERMEYDILQCLKWQVHPPIPHDFLHLVLSIKDEKEEDRETLGLARFLVELSVMDCFFVSYKPSQIAMAALVTGKKYSSSNQKLHPPSATFEYDSPPIQDCCDRLGRLYARVLEEGDMEQHVAGGQATSPVSVRML